MRGDLTKSPSRLENRTKIAREKIVNTMIDKELVRQIVEEKLAATDCFVVDVTVSASNAIVVEIDNETGIDIDFCVELSRFIETKLDREVEDYELEVGSAGLTSPFKVRRQYDKNIGNEVELLTKDGRKLTGTLAAVNEADFTVEITKMVKPEGAKRKVAVVETETLAFDAAKYVRLKF